VATQEVTREGGSYEVDRYMFTKVYVDDSVSRGRVRFGRWREGELPLDRWTSYVLTDKDIGRLDNVAYKVYKNVRLWPIIARYNGIRNMLEDMVVGQELRIPPLEEIRKAGVLFVQ